STRTIPTAIGDQSVVIMDPVARKTFARLRAGKPLGNLGLNLGLTSTSPANVQVRVFDDSSSGKADKVYSLLQRAGFDVKATEAWKGSVRLKGPMLLYRQNEKKLGDV